MNDKPETKKIMPPDYEDDYLKDEWEALLAENNQRLLALNGRGMQVNGIEQAYMVRVLEYIVDSIHPEALNALKLEQQQWISSQLNTAEQQLNEYLEQQDKEARKRIITGGGPSHERPAGRFPNGPPGRVRG